MESLSVSLDLRPFKSLLNGLRMHLFPISGEEVSEDDLVLIFQKANSELDINDIRNEITLFNSILKKAASDNWTVEVLQDFLESRGFPTEHTTLFVEFWRKESPRIHSYLLQQVSHNHSMLNLAWRVDMKALSKNSSEENAPIAYFELGMHARRDDNSGGAEKRVTKFDMNRSEVQEMLSQLNSIQVAYDQLLTATK